MQPVLINFLYKNKDKRKDSTNNNVKNNNLDDKHKVTKSSNKYIKKELDYNPFFFSF